MQSLLYIDFTPVITDSTGKYVLNMQTKYSVYPDSLVLNWTLTKMDQT